MHRAGPEDNTSFGARRNGYILRYFQSYYLSRIPNGRVNRINPFLHRILKGTVTRLSTRLSPPARLFSTRQQELLLRAALLTGPASVDAWERWRAATDFDGYLDNESFHLLPLLYTNLRRYRVTDPFVHKLKGIYRLAWCKNQVIFRDIEDVLGALHEAGVKTMLLNEAALTLLHYKDRGARPVTDIDVLVPVTRAQQVIELLAQSGWTPATPLLVSQLRYGHSLLIKNRSGREFNLHWDVLSECWQEDVDSDFWRDAVPLRMNNVVSHALNSTDTLLHFIVHGMKWNPEPPIRWIADAITIINSADAEIDWLRLDHQAQKRRLGNQVRMGLKFLYDTFNARIPKAVIQGY